MKVLAVLFGVALVIMGATNIGVALTNPRPTEMTCREFFEQSAPPIWVTLKGCDVHYLDYATTYLDAFHTTPADAQQTWYVSIGNPPPYGIRLLMRVQDAESQALLKQLYALTWQMEQPEDATPELQEFIAKNIDKLERKDVTLTGLLGGREENIDRAKFKGRKRSGLDRNYRTLAAGEEPMRLIPALLLGAGLVLLVLAARGKL